MTSAPRLTSRSGAKLVFFLLFFAATILVLHLKDGQIFDPTSPIARHFAPATLYLIPHAAFGGLAMLLAVFQFSNNLRARYLNVHKTLGYAYVVSVFIAAPMSIPLALKTVSLSLI